MLEEINRERYLSHVEKDEQGNIIWAKLLHEHLEEVGRMAKSYISRLPNEYKQELAEAARLAGVCHDFGKYTTYFQDYLIKDVEQGNRHHHGFISAIFAAYCMEKQLTSFSMPFSKYLPLLVYIAVLHHHGPLEDASNTLVPSRRLKVKIFPSRSRAAK